MRMPHRIASALVAGVAIAASPATAELTLQTPAVGLSFLLVLGALLIDAPARSGRGTMRDLAFLVAVGLAPLHLWPLAIWVCAAGSDSPRWRWPVRLTVTAIALGFGVWARVDMGRVAADTDVMPSKGLLAVTNVELAARSAFMPWGHGLAGGILSAGPELGVVLAGMAVFGMALLVWLGRHRRHGALGFVICAALVAPLAPGFLDRARAADGALFGWAMICSLALFVTARIDVRVPARAVRVPMAMALVLAASWTYASVRAAVPRWGVWVSPERAYQALLEEHPRSLVRWEYAGWLLAQGRDEESRAETTRFLQQHSGLGRRKLAYGLHLVRTGHPDAAKMLEGLPTALIPAEGADAEALLGFYERRSDWEQALRVGAALKAPTEDQEFRLLGAAQASENAAKTAEYVRRLMVRPHPPLRALMAAFEDRWKRQDLEAIREVAARAIQLYPDHAFGYHAQGRGARLLRDDAAMVTWYSEALARDPALVTIHEDLARTYHGSESTFELALTHYRRVLELAPDHPRADVYRSRIEALEGHLGKSVGKSKGED